MEDSAHLELKRTLRFRDLVPYGIILIQPTAATTPLTILLAMVPMLLTSIT